MKIERQSTEHGDVRYILTLDAAYLLNLPPYLLKQLQSKQAHDPISDHLLTLFRIVYHYEMLQTVVQWQPPPVDQALQNHLAKLDPDTEPVTDILDTLGHESPPDKH